MPFDHRTEHEEDGMWIIQSNYDDMNPEFTSYVMDRLFDAGANDVYWVPIIMKKGRPGMMLNVLVHETYIEVMKQIIFTETTTLGLRMIPASCHRLKREWKPVQTKWGIVSVKLGYYRNRLVQYAPEFNDCEKIAKQSGVPLKQVYEEAGRIVKAMIDDDLEGRGDRGRYPQ